MLPQRTIDAGLYGALFGALCFLALPGAALYRLPWLQPPSPSAATIQQLAKEGPTISTAKGPAAPEQMPQRLIAVWKSGSLGGVTVLDDKGVPHTLKIGEEFGRYRLREAGKGKAIFSGSTGDLALSLNALPVAPNLAAMGVRNPTGGATLEAKPDLSTERPKPR